MKIKSKKKWAVMKVPVFTNKRNGQQSVVLSRKMLNIPKDKKQIKIKVPKDWLRQWKI